MNQLKIYEQVPSLPLFDRGAFDFYFGGTRVAHSAEIFENCAQRLFASLPDRIAMMDSALASKDREALKTTAHFMRSSFAALGGTRLGWICETIEQDADFLSFEELKQYIEDLKLTIPYFTSHLKTFVSNDLPRLKEANPQASAGN